MSGLDGKQTSSSAAIAANNISKAVVVGGGLMGAGLVVIIARAGCHVYMVDINEAMLERGMQRVRENLDMLVSLGKLPKEEVEPILARVKATTSASQAADGVQFVMEAVSENLPLKQAIFEEWDRLTPPTTILATNSTGFSVGDVAQKTRHPERVVGSHFFTPHLIVPLVEIGYGLATTDEVVETTVAFWRRCGKDTVVCRKNQPGFLVNRLQAALAREAMSLLANGAASAVDIEKATRMGLGLRLPLWGMLEQRDWSGLDVHCAGMASVYPTLETSKVPLPVLAERVARGQIGVKAGKGFFDWTGKDVEAIRQKKQWQLLQLIDTVEHLMADMEELEEAE